MTSRALITPRTPIQNAVMNAAAKLNSLKMVSIATISMNVPWVPINETKILLVKIILVHMDVNAPMVTVLNAKMSTNTNCHPVMKMRRARILLDVTIVSAMIVSMVTDFRVFTSKSTILDSRHHQFSKFATFSNALGSYTCKCISGFKGDGYNCDNIDECELEIIIVSLMLNFTIPSDHILVNATLDSLVMERLMTTSMSVRIQDSMEPIRFALMNQVVTNVTVT